MRFPRAGRHRGDRGARRLHHRERADLRGTEVQEGPTAGPVDRGLPEIDMDDEAWKTSGSFTNSVQTASMFMNSGLSFTIFWGRWKTFL